MTHDIGIIGTGPAGLTAALLAGRYGFETVLFERDELGGGLVNEHTIETYPGFPDGIAGPDLRERIVTQIREYDVDLELSAVTELTTGDQQRIHTEAKTFDSEAVIVATGGRPRRLSCPGAREFEGNGVFFCALCDGPLYREKRVAVVGRGERALRDSLFLTDFASEVCVLGNRTALAPSEYAQKKAESSPKIEIRPHAEVTAITGDDVVTGIELSDYRSERKSAEEVDGVLMRLGSRPNMEFLPPEIETADTGHVTVNGALETSIEGVFAAGTVREHAVSRVSVATGDGTTAFHSAQRYLY